MIRARYREWILPALACAAMLVLPALSWLLIPRPGVFVLPPAPSAASVAVASIQSATPSSPNGSRARPARGAHPTLDARPAAAGPVIGVVLDAEGHPAKEATVSCNDTDAPLVATTDEEGRFQLAPEAAGCVAVARHAEGFPSEGVILAAGTGNTLRLSRGGGIEGDVVDERSAPVTSYLLGIEAYQGGSMDRAPTGQSKSIQDARGAFAWENLPPGRYVLTASSEGRPPARSRMIDVEAGRSTAHVRISLARGATLSGRVLDAATRKPIAGATVTLDAFTTTRAQGVKPTRSDDQGAYTLDGAPPGPFSVRVTRDGYRPRTVTGLTTRGAPTLHEDIELNAIVDGGPTGEDFAGIGAFLQASPTGVSFQRLVPDGPAEKAGIHPGDVIRRIDGADASAFAVVDCMQNLRGPDGSRVTVQVERAGQRVDVTIQRRALTL